MSIFSKVAAPLAWSRPGETVRPARVVASVARVWADRGHSVASQVLPVTGGSRVRPPASRLQFSVVANFRCHGVGEVVGSDPWVRERLVVFMMFSCFVCTKYQQFSLADIHRCVRTQVCNPPPPPPLF